MRLERAAKFGLVPSADHGLGRVAVELQLGAGVGGQDRARIVDRDHCIQRKAVGVPGHRLCAALDIVVGQREPASRIHIRERLIVVGRDDHVQTELVRGRHEVGRAIGSGRYQEHHARHELRLPPVAATYAANNDHGQRIADRDPAH